MAHQPRKPGTPLGVEDLVHNEARRKNIPTVEHQSVMQQHEQMPAKVQYPRGDNGLDDEKARRNHDFDPQLIWRGKDQQDWSDLVVNTRMSVDLHMAEDLKNTGKDNLFAIFGEPDVDVLDTQGHSIRRYDGKRDIIDVPPDGQRVVKINGVDVPPRHRRSAQRRRGRHRLLVSGHQLRRGILLHPPRLLPRRERPLQGAENHPQNRNRPRRLGKCLNSDTSRPFPKPGTGRFAVKVINHPGDEVMKVFRVT
jgi:hypothetical protein